MENNEERFWQEGMDGKRFALCLFRWIWILPVVGAAGSAAAAGIYLLATVVFGGKPQYEVSSLYRIYFDSERYGEIQDYYNAYTWGDIMKTDEVLDHVMEALPEEVTKEQVREAVSVGQMNDVRIMPLSVITEDAALSQSIAEAYGYGLPRFAEALVGLTGMERWRMDPVAEVPRATKTGRAGILGFCLGAVGTFFVLLLYLCLDDSVYLEEDLTGRYAWPVLGIITQKRDGRALRELWSNWQYILAGKREIWLTGPCAAEGKRVLEECIALEKGIGDGPAPEKGATDMPETGRKEKGRPERILFRQASWPLSPEETAGMRENGAVLLLPWGTGDGRVVRHMALQLEKQRVEILGAVIYGASDGFLRAYYGKGKKPQP